jgi:hypothetical protein
MQTKSIKNYADSVKYHINGMPDVAHIVKKLAPNITENKDRRPIIELKYIYEEGITITTFSELSYIIGNM